MKENEDGMGKIGLLGVDDKTLRFFLSWDMATLFFFMQHIITD